MRVVPYALPHRGGKPYLWEELVLWHDYNRIGVAIMDDQQRSPLSQLKGFASSFSRLVACLGERLRMLAVTGTGEPSSDLLPTGSPSRGDEAFSAWICNHH